MHRTVAQLLIAIADGWAAAVVARVVLGGDVWLEYGSFASSDDKVLI